MSIIAFAGCSRDSGATRPVRQRRAICSRSRCRALAASMRPAAWRFLQHERIVLEQAFVGINSLFVFHDMFRSEHAGDEKFGVALREFLAAVLVDAVFDPSHQDYLQARAHALHAFACLWRTCQQDGFRNTLVSSMFRSGHMFADAVQVRTAAFGLDAVRKAIRSPAAAPSGALIPVGMLASVRHDLATLKHLQDPHVLQAIQSVICELDPNPTHDSTLHPVTLELLVAGSATEYHDQEEPSDQEEEEVKQKASEAAMAAKEEAERANNRIDNIAESYTK